MSNVVDLRPRPLYLKQPDWVAFASVLQNLWRLEDMPAKDLAEGLYCFSFMGGPFQAEQLLDEIDMVTSNIRSAIQKHRLS